MRAVAAGRGGELGVVREAGAAGGKVIPRGRRVMHSDAAGGEARCRRRPARRWLRTTAGVVHVHKRVIHIMLMEGCNACFRHAAGDGKLSVLHKRLQTKLQIFEPEYRFKMATNSPLVRKYI